MTMTRSTRGAERPLKTDHHLNRLPAANVGKKRVHASIDDINGAHGALRDYKRPKITVEILSAPQFHTKRAVEAADIQPKRARANNTTKPKATRPSQQPATAATTAHLSPNRTKQTENLRLPPSQEQSTATGQDGHVEKPYERKVISGIKHELDRLQPSSEELASSQGGQRRKLRSQETTRFKSELSSYFLDYDEVIGNDVAEKHLLNVDTPIVMVRSAPGADTGEGQAALPRDLSYDSRPVRTYDDELFTQLNDAYTIDFTFLDTDGADAEDETATVDPLADSKYTFWHKKAERLERSIRNAEKSRAQHEKDQIVRLRDGLQGHDWLRLMGVNGITDTKKKSFEPAREHFIKECEGILDKFRNWAAEERRRKLEKQQAKLGSEGTPRTSVDDEDDAGDDDDDGDEDDEEEIGRVAKAGDKRGRRDSDHSNSASDDSLTKQLKEEVLMARSRIAAKKPKPPPKTTPSKAPVPAEEMKSFFRKTHERDAALSTTRRRGRSVMAWGQPLPDPEPREFELPGEILDADMIRAQERKRRYDKRAART